MEWRTRLDILSILTDNPDLEVATPVIIKVTDVETKKEFKMVYKSPAFLTHSNGHKVYLCSFVGTKRRSWRRPLKKARLVTKITKGQQEAILLQCDIVG